MDFNWINERIALGAGVNTPEDANQVVAAGITSVVDMRAEFDDHTIFADRDVDVCWIPQFDDGSPRPAKQVLAGIIYVLTVLTHIPNKVLLHCAAGINRGPTECYAVLRAMGFTQVDAIALIRAKRPQVGFFNIKAYVDSVEDVIAQKSS